MVRRCHGLNLPWKHDRTQGRCNSFCPGQMLADEWKQHMAHALLLQMRTEGIYTEMHLSFYRGRDERCHGDEMGHPGMWQMPHWGSRIYSPAWVSISFPWQQCTAVPVLATLNSFLPSALLLLFASPVAQRLQPFSGTYHHFPITLCQVQFPFFNFIKKKKSSICCLVTLM